MIFFLRFTLNFLLLNFTPSFLVIPSCTVLTILSLFFFFLIQAPFKLIYVSHQSSSSKVIDMALSFFLILSHHLVPSALIASLLLSLSQQFVNIFVRLLFPDFMQRCRCGLRLTPSNPIATLTQHPYT